MARKTSKPRINHISLLLTITSLFQICIANTQAQQRSTPLERRQSSSDYVPLIVTNNCSDTVWPAIHSDKGTGPEQHGFELKPREQKNFTVSRDWKGRVWARTNCTFPNSAEPRPACRTGDCAGALDCVVTGLPPVTLAEFLLDGFAKLAYYDISLVDGYNIGMAILVHPNGIAEVEGASRNISNPSCVGSVGDFPDKFMPYNGQQQFLGTGSGNPLPFALDVTRKQLSRWCPFDLLPNPPKKPGDGVYPYPDDNIQRDVFQPCYSACAKYNDPKDCCTGAYNDPNKCKPGLYSKQAKEVCPDAYSYAYDDKDSTFTITAGAGFEVVMCPAGRSTKILKTLSQSAGSAQKARAKTSSAASSYGDNTAPPWLTLMAAALVVTACVFSSL